MNTFGKRYVDGDRLVSIIEGRMGTCPEVKDYLRRAPKLPKLIGRARAAEILGVGSPYMAHFINSGRLKPITVEGGKDAYDEAEVKALHAQRRRDAKKKEKAK